MRLGGSLTIEDVHNLLAQKEVQEQVKRETRENGGRQVRTETAPRRCGSCRKPGQSERNVSKI